MKAVMTLYTATKTLWMKSNSAYLKLSPAEYRNKTLIQPSQSPNITKHSSFPLQLKKQKALQYNKIIIIIIRLQ